MPPRAKAATPAAAAAAAAAALPITPVPFDAALLSARGWNERADRIVAQETPVPARPALVLSSVAPTLVSLLREFAGGGCEPCPKEVARLRRILRRPPQRNLFLRRRALSRFVPQRGNDADANMRRMLVLLTVLMDRSDA